MFAAEDIEKVKEMERCGHMRTAEGNFQVFMAKLTDVDSLVKAFEGCRGVFHTSAFTDPAGLSGYTVSVFSHYFMSLLRESFKMLKRFWSI